MDEEKKERFEKLYKESYNALFLYAFARLRDRPLAEEAVQSTFLIACAKPQNLLESPNPRGWLTVTLKNVLRNMSSRNLRQLRLLERLLDAAQARPEEGGPELLLYETLSNVLSKDEILLFRRTVFERCPLFEVAEELGITVHACRKRLQRAKKKVRNYLEKLE